MLNNLLLQLELSSRVEFFRLTVFVELRFELSFVAIPTLISSVATPITFSAYQLNPFSLKVCFHRL